MATLAPAPITNHAQRERTTRDQTRRVLLQTWPLDITTPRRARRPCLAGQHAGREARPRGGLTAALPGDRMTLATQLRQYEGLESEALVRVVHPEEAAA